MLFLLCVGYMCTYVPAQGGVCVCVHICVCKLISRVCKNDLCVRCTISKAQVTSSPSSLCLSLLRYKITTGSRQRG